MLQKERKKEKERKKTKFANTEVKFDLLLVSCRS